MPGKKRKRFALGQARKTVRAKSTTGADDTKPEEVDKKFEIDFIVDHRIIEDEEKIQFKVRWQGYHEADDTWEDFELFAFDAPDIVSEYLVKVFSKKNK
jgi:hypothetical protein